MVISVKEEKDKVVRVDKKLLENAMKKLGMESAKGCVDEGLRRILESGRKTCDRLRDENKELRRELERCNRKLQDVTEELHRCNVTLHGRNVTLHGRNVTLQGRNMEKKSDVHKIKCEGCGATIYLKNGEVVEYDFTTKRKGRKKQKEEYEKERDKAKRELKKCEEKMNKIKKEKEDLEKYYVEGSKLYWQLMEYIEIVVEELKKQGKTYFEIPRSYKEAGRKVFKGVK